MALDGCGKRGMSSKPAALPDGSNPAPELVAMAPEAPAAAEEDLSDKPIVAASRGGFLAALHHYLAQSALDMIPAVPPLPPTGKDFELISLAEEEANDVRLLQILGQKSIVQLLDGAVSLASAPDANQIGWGEDARDLLDVLGQKSITQLLEDGAVSLTSVTDANQTSFKNKHMYLSIDDLSETSGIGFTCRKGLKPDSLNQDSWFVVQAPGNFAMYGVADGHGRGGEELSDFVKENLPKLVIRDPRFKQRRADMKGICMDAFEKMQELIAAADGTNQLSAQMTGCTATLAIHNEFTKKLTVAHLGNSTCCLFDEKTGEVETLTRDHKPELEDERSRIEKSGARVIYDGYVNHRIYVQNDQLPGLNLSRSFGDLFAHRYCGVISTPEVAEVTLRSDQVLLLCTDGVWEFLTPKQAIDIVKEFPSHKSQEATETLAKQSWDLWMTEEGGAVVDDITVILAHLVIAEKKVFRLEIDGDILTLRELNGEELCHLSGATILGLEDLNLRLQNQLIAVGLDQAYEVLLPDGTVLSDALSPRGVLADGTDTEEARGLPQRLSQKSISQLLEDGAVSDPGRNRTSFENRRAHASGDDLSEWPGVGVTCRKSMKAELPNQDSWFVVQAPGDFAMYGVADGHGRGGEELSDFVKENLPKLVIQDPRFKQRHADMKVICIDAFEQMQKLIVTADRTNCLSAQLAACTATLVIHDHVIKKLTVAHIGNSTCCLFDKQTGDVELLTRNHRPDLEDERARIEKFGARVVNDGIGRHDGCDTSFIHAQNDQIPLLKQSRSFGDLLAHKDCGVISTPEVVEATLRSDQVLLLCTNGVWEFLTPNQAIDIVKEFPSHKSQEATETLARKSRDAWKFWVRKVAFDITVILAHLVIAESVSIRN